MKTKILKLISFILILQVSFSLGAENTISLNKTNSSSWLPLIPNSTWIYKTYENRYSPYGPSVLVFVKLSKMSYAKDTIINGKTYAVILHDLNSAQINYFTNPLFIRYDATGNKYYALFNNVEKLFFDPVADSGTVIPDLFRLGKKEFANIFGETREVWNINPIVGGYGNIKLVKGLGLFFSTFQEYGGYIDSLKGCVIGGQVYGDTSLATSVEQTIVPDKFQVYQNYPNPFNSQTIISFTLPERQNVQLKIYNSIGKEIETFNLGEMNIGNHKINFDAGSLPSGIYFYRVITPKYSAVKKMILVK